jgi:hypothetical protein
MGHGRGIPPWKRGGSTSLGPRVDGPYLLPSQQLTTVPVPSGLHIYFYHGLLDYPAR